MVVLEEDGDYARVEGGDTWVDVSDCVSIGGGM
jgi:hypothetical protein